MTQYKIYKKNQNNAIHETCKNINKKNKEKNQDKHNYMNKQIGQNEWKIKLIKCAYRQLILMEWNLDHLLLLLRWDEFV